MCIYCTTDNYRKIYENHNGPIPRDSEGRSYHIHHRDGNRSNNSPENLVALSINDHYELHLSQRDYGAAERLGRLLKLDHNWLIELNRKNQTGWGIYYDADGNKIRTTKEDPRVKEQGLVYANAGSTRSYDTYYVDGELIKLRTDDSRVVNGEVLHKNAVILKYRDKNDNILHLHKDDPRIIEENLVYVSKGKMLGKSNYRDSDGKRYSLSKNDPIIVELGLVNIGKGSIKPKTPCKHCGRMISNNSLSVHQRSCKSNPSPTKLYRDSAGNRLELSSTDQLVVEGKVTEINTNKGYANFRDMNGNLVRLKKNDPLIKSQGLISTNAGTKKNYPKVECPKCGKVCASNQMTQHSRACNKR